MDRPASLEDAFRLARDEAAPHLSLVKDASKKAGKGAGHDLERANWALSEVILKLIPLYQFDMIGPVNLAPPYGHPPSGALPSGSPPSDHTLLDPPLPMLHLQLQDAPSITTVGREVLQHFSVPVEEGTGAPGVRVLLRNVVLATGRAEGLPLVDEDPGCLLLTREELKGRDIKEP